MCGSQKCCGELAEVTVDDIWRNANAVDQELRTLAQSQMAMYHGAGNNRYITNGAYGLGLVRFNVNT